MPYIISNPTWLFHATFAFNMAAIAAEGLTPNNDRKPNHDGYAIDGRLFASGDFNTAEFYAHTLVDDYMLDTVLLRFHGAVVNASKDANGMVEDVFLTSAVAPEYIEIWYRQRWLTLDRYLMERENAPAPSRPSMERMN